MSVAESDGEADLVVVGAGLGGYCAALQGAQAGASVILIEKQAEAGGTSIMSGGLFAFAGTDLQRASGIDDNDTRFYDDLRRVGNYANDDALVHKYIEHQLGTYYWLKGHGVQFGAPEASGGQSVPRSHTTSSPQVFAALGEHIAATKNINVMMNTRVERLVRNGADGRVTGVIAGHDGHALTISARHGVIVTSGGFSRNRRLIECFAPLQVDVNTVCGIGCGGDGLLMTLKLGAGLRDMAYVKSTFGNHPDAGSVRHRVLFPVYRGAIAVNRSGCRFFNESANYKALGDACLQQTDGIAFQIFDQTVMDKSSAGVVTFDFGEALESGFLLKAATLAELATKIGLDANALTETVNCYNDAIRCGRPDEFGRTALTNAFGTLGALERPPYYAYPSVNVMLGTYCGITIDAAARVVDVFDAPIEGLFAAGEVHGGFHGAAYMTGSGLGKAAIFGRIAAASALGVQLQ